MTAPGTLSAPTLDLISARNARLRAMFEFSPLGIVASDRDGYLVECNAAYERMLGYREDELRQMRFVDLSPGDAVAESVRVFGEAVDGLRDSFVVEKICRRKDGREIWVRVTGTAVRSPTGEFENCVATVEDITEARRMAQALRDSEERHRTLLEALPVIVYRADAEPPFATHYISPGISILGRSVEEWIGSPSAWLDSVHPDDRARVIEHANLTRAEHRRFDCEYRMIAADGTELWVHDQGDFVYDAAGKPTAWQGVIHDITANQLLEEQLRQSQKMQAVGQLAGGVAHDFNNLLTVISGRAQFLRVATPGSSDWIENIDEVCTAASRAASLTRQLLAFSRKQLLKPKLLHFNDVVAGLTPLLQRLIDEDVELATQLAAGTASIHADPGQIEQVLVNLVVNAHHAMPHGGKVLISTRSETVPEGSELSLNNERAVGRYVVLSVEDTGLGMDAETLSRVFEPFFTTKEPGQGTGLGLSTAYGIAKQSGGFMTARSTPHVGSVFELFLPAAPAAKATPRSVDVVVPDLHGTETILLVEDSDAVRKLAELILRKHGYTVLPASDGLEATELSAAHAGTIDLLLTDLVMPRMSGREVADAVTAQRPDVRVLYMSGYTDDVIIRKGLGDREASFLEKPFSPTSLANRVRQRLDV